MHCYLHHQSRDKRVERREDTIVKTEGSILDQGDGRTPSRTLSSTLANTKSSWLWTTRGDRYWVSVKLRKLIRTDVKSTPPDCAIWSWHGWYRENFASDKFATFESVSDSTARKEASGAGPAEIETVKLEMDRATFDSKQEWREVHLVRLVRIKETRPKAPPKFAIACPSGGGALHCHRRRCTRRPRVYFFQQQFWYHPNVGQINARAGDLLTIKMHARDRFARYCLEGMANARSSRVWTERCAIRGGYQNLLPREEEAKSEAKSDRCSRKLEVMSWVTVGGLRCRLSRELSTPQSTPRTRTKVRCVRRRKRWH